ncbi:helix-turn-helix domain-containing protein [Zhihengliuella sp.]|uniref:TetR/AcrR family transcriptional regulator n=1 Tax=Zhihengliuella sp. TaxID=1954483 RepID=UPI0028114DA8|nr:helix-turn-helix domain-containing protein [Zhihengliuella sp.]
MTDSAIPQDALRLLISDGFEATSVDQLATAAGMSRSTFFRRYGSKEGMVFADLDGILAAVEHGLAPLRERAEPVPADGAAAGSRPEDLAERDRSAAPDAGILETLLTTALSVFDHHTGHAEVSRLRHRLLSAVPALRDRELVSTHRYERAFRRALRPLLDDDATSAALAAAIVAVHNTRLRQWLRSEDQAAAATAAARASLESDLRRVVGQLLRIPSAAGGPGEGTTGGTPGSSPGPRRPAGVVVTVLEAAPDGSLDEAAVLDAVRAQLRDRPVPPTAQAE